MANLRNPFNKKYKYAAPKFLICMFVNIDWFYISHRSHIMKSVIKDGMDFKAYAEFSERTTENLRKATNLFNSPLKRHDQSIFSNIKSFYRLLFLISELTPSVIHAVTIKPIIVLGTIARIWRLNFIASISGLGPAFNNKSLSQKFRNFVLKRIYRWIFSNENSIVICQSQHDMNFLLEYQIASKQQIRVINSSGVDMDIFKPKKIKRKKITVLMASRLLREKGVELYIRAASKILQDFDLRVEFLLAGSVDPYSPSSYTLNDVEILQGNSGVNYLGAVDNMASLLQQVDLFVLPTYYAEGVPKVLIEAAACGCAILTTNHAGCPEAVIDGISGQLVPPQDLVALQNALLTLVSNRNKLYDMGVAGREFVKNSHSDKKISSQHVAIYNEFRE